MPKYVCGALLKLLHEEHCVGSLYACLLLVLGLLDRTFDPVGSSSNDNAIVWHVRWSGCVVLNTLLRLTGLGWFQHGWRFQTTIFSVVVVVAAAAAVVVLGC